MVAETINVQTNLNKNSVENMKNRNSRRKIFGAATGLLERMVGKNVKGVDTPSPTDLLSSFPILMSATPVVGVAAPAFAPAPARAARAPASATLAGIFVGPKTINDASNNELHEGDVVELADPVKICKYNKYLGNKKYPTGTILELNRNEKDAEFRVFLSFAPNVTGFCNPKDIKFVKKGDAATSNTPQSLDDLIAIARTYDDYEYYKDKVIKTKKLVEGTNAYNAWLPIFLKKFINIKRKAVVTPATSLPNIPAEIRALPLDQDKNFLVFNLNGQKDNPFNREVYDSILEHVNRIVYKINKIKLTPEEKIMKIIDFFNEIHDNLKLYLNKSPAQNSHDYPPYIRYNEVKDDEINKKITPTTFIELHVNSLLEIKNKFPIKTFFKNLIGVDISLFNTDNQEKFIEFFKNAYYLSDSVKVRAERFIKSSPPPKKRGLFGFGHGGTRKRKNMRKRKNSTIRRRK